MPTYIELKCKYCKKIFKRSARLIASCKCKNTKNYYCSKECQTIDSVTKQNVECRGCGKNFLKLLNQIKKYSNHFCSHSCAATYNNTHKTKGYRVSKLEIWLQSQLPLLYPNLEFHFNRKDTINSELDIYIPSLKLAFELNGIFHYEAIYGQERLDKIQNNDNRKYQACIENNIELCIIDASNFKNFKEEKAKKFLDIIKNILDLKLSISLPVI